MLIAMLRFANQMLGGYFNVFLIIPEISPPSCTLMYVSDRVKVVSSYYYCIAKIPRTGNDSRRITVEPL